MSTLGAARDFWVGIPVHKKKYSHMGGNNPSSRLDIVLTNSIMFRQTVTGKHGMCPTWEEFVTKHAQNVLNAALRVVGNSDDADDVAQEVFLEIFKNNRMYEYAEKPALIRTIATRRALDRLRRRKKAIRLDGRELDLRVSDPCESIVAAELDQQLRDALVNVPPREAEIFCLSAFEGYSTTEIAQMLSISKGAVAKSLCLARSRLSAAFGLKQTEVKK